MANSYNKNNLVKTCGSSDTNSKCTNDEQNNAGSFSSSDVCSPKRSVIQSTNTKMEKSNFIATLSTTASYRYKEHNMNVPNILHYNQTIKIFHQNIRSLRNKTNELFAVYKMIHLIFYVLPNIISNTVSWFYRTLKTIHWGLTTVEILNTWVVYVCIYKRTYHLLVWKLKINQKIRILKYVV